MQYAALILGGVGLLLIAMGWLGVALGKARFHGALVLGIFAIMLSAACGLFYLCILEPFNH